MANRGLIVMLLVLLVGCGPRKIRGLNEPFAAHGSGAGTPDELVQQAKAALKTRDLTALQTLVMTSKAGDVEKDSFNQRALATMERGVAKVEYFDPLPYLAEEQKYQHALTALNETINRNESTPESLAADEKRFTAAQKEIDKKFKQHLATSQIKTELAKAFETYRQSAEVVNPMPTLPLVGYLIVTMQDDQQKKAILDQRTFDVGRDPKGKSYYLTLSMPRAIAPAKTVP